MIADDSDYSDAGLERRFADNPERAKQLTCVRALGDAMLHQRDEERRVRLGREREGL